MIRIGITSIPQRVHLLHQTLRSLLSQTITTVEIWVNLPEYTRSGIPYPDFKFEDDRVIVNRCEDKGPITKLYPLLSVSQSDDIIILADDDHIYAPDMIELLTESVKRFAAVGFAGRRYRQRSLHFVSEVSSPALVDFLETYAGVAYMRNALADEAAIDQIQGRCREAFFCDDIVIGRLLRTAPYVIPASPGMFSFNAGAGDTPQLHHSNLIGRNERVYRCVNLL